MNLDDLTHDTKPLVIGDCEFGHQIDDMIYVEKLKDESKPDILNTTNIIVTKYADSTSDILDMESTLNLDNKEKVIEVELLSTNAHHKNNFTSLFNGALVKKALKKKSDDDTLIYEKKKKFKEDTNLKAEAIKKIDMEKNEYVNPNSDGISVCGECQKQFTSKAVFKKHTAVCREQPLGAALCSKCGKHFSSNYNLKRHMTSCKLCPDNEKSPRYMCQCGRTYSQEWDMKKHKLKCKDGKKKCKHCLITNCNLLFYHKAQLIAHMKKDHNMIIQDPKILNFNSFDEFLLWKEKEEEETFTYYSKQTGSNVSGVSVNTYYVCQHDGSDRTHTSTPRKTERRNKKGRIKTGRLCWSQMNVKQFKDGTVRVTYFPSHTHPVSIADTEHHPLPSSISMEIKRRFSEISKISETEDLVTDDSSQELKKGRRKRYGMSLRTLKALARKNRSLFRITAEAMQQKPEGVKEAFDARPASDFQFSCSKNLASASNPMQIIMPDPEEENPDDPDPIQVFNAVSNPPDTARTADQALLEDCINYLNDVKTHLLSGKVSQALAMQIKESLKSVCDIWRENERIPDEMITTVLPERHENSVECQEVLMYRPQPSLPVSEIFPLQDEVNSTMEVTDELKNLETPEKAVYQIIAVDGEAKNSNEYLYQNGAEIMGPREFIIIAGDHAQLFQSVESEIQFDLR